MKRIICTLLIGMVLFTFGGISFAADIKIDEERSRAIDRLLFIAAGTQNRVLKIGLVDMIAYALKSNSEILIKQIDPKLKEDDVKIARADFEPIFSADYTLHSNAKASSSSLSGANISHARDVDFNAGMSGKLITGTEYAIDFINERYKSNSSFQSMNPYYTTEPKITITQPVFRDSGVFVNTADIVIAQNDKKVSEEDFKEVVMDIITKTKAAYYNFTYFLESYSIANSSLERAKDLLEISKARYKKGLASSLDLLETETAVADREKALISAEASLKKAEDDLKLITNLVDDPELWNAKLELIDDKLEFNKQNLDLFKCLKNSFQYRPDYNSNKIDLENKGIKILTAQDALFPTVDLVGSFGLNGLGKDYQDALDNTKGDYRDWSVGFKINVPWGGSERAKLDQRKLELAQAIIAFKRLEQNIILNVRDEIRAVDIAIRQIDASRFSKEKEIRNYQAQKERYAAGQVSTHDILDYQENLASAELDYIKSLIDYNIAIVNLDKSQGLTLIKNNILLEG
ncbi:MAG: hypothetical protein CO035_06060 [Candidatus Omnitrophica bacterium CG_4_9_14_0_2_um_filter_42_8]|nr:MAG: hypothetical protein COW92_02425 [Candidatus Omnitrophica bacterium CG22_combo_CG10-13_8_21_14_all_43_16]PJC47581.1 MAG: hypothetical protein CO035_06060 [Candidatus Omnitrophica bacterium CG_4_9_14_0_2_um_filter_42_8]